MRKQVAALEALGYPSGDRATLSAIYADTRSILATISADPSSATDEDFVSVNARLNAYGLTTCGQ